MTSRERLLIGAIALLAVGAVGVYTLTSMTGAIAKRKANLATVQNELNRKNVIIRTGANAVRNLAKLRQQSLPADQEKARSLYQRWLLDLVVDKVGLQNPSVRVTDRMIRGSYFSRLSFQVDGQASLDQTVQFLHGFYSSDDLHRIQNFSLKPVSNSDSRQLDMSVSIEAIILPGNKREVVGDLVSNRMEELTLDDYQTAILNRNAFAPANLPPKLDEVRDTNTYRGDRFSLKIEADDEDERDNLTYELEGPFPEGMEINAKSGTLRWRPEENGEFTLRVKVTDDGTPALSDSTEFLLTVADPPPEPEQEDEEPEKPRFDEAEFAFLIGTVADGAEREIWLKVRTTGKLLRLSKGDRIRVGTVRGTVESIGNKEVNIRTEDGDLKVRVGQSLTEGRLTDPTGQAASS
ncbi:MAG: hypothetical protein GY768_12615 [Planctomycetaceae bacterium]|nr:hypothetical protein [Planctomycetaceae bacterium]